VWSAGNAHHRKVRELVRKCGPVGEAMYDAAWCKAFGLPAFDPDFDPRVHF